MRWRRPARGASPGAGGRFRWRAAARSHTGLVRSVNEDACLVRPERGLWAVADGMGGHAIGDFASRTVVAALDEVRPAASLAQLVAGARERLHTANRRLRTEAAARDLPIIGSTVVVLAACDGACGYLWAGDSRLYLCRSGRLRLLTRDHRLAVALGVPGSFGSAVTRAVGAVDALDLEGATVEAHDGDILVLCSDGLSDAVSDREIAAALVTGDCARAADALVDLALARGGRDNVSAVVVRAEDLQGERTLLNPAL
jgi:protein phosphatase